MDNGSQAYVTFRISGEYFAFPAEHISEMMPVQALVEAAQPSPGLLGVIYSRGRRVPVFDVGHALGLPPASNARPGRLVIARNSSLFEFGFCVDKLTDMIDVRPHEIRGNLIQGHGRAKTVLHPDQIVSSEVLAGLMP